MAESWGWKTKQWRRWHSRLQQKVKQDVASNTYSHNILTVDRETVLGTEWFVVPPRSSPTSSEKHTGEEKKSSSYCFGI